MNPVKYLTCMLLVLTLAACKKDKEPASAEPRTFAEINLQHIKQKESLMGDEAIQTSGVNGVGWTTGEVYLYRTRSGLFGKFRVGTIEPAENYRLTISAVTYNDDGSVHKEIEKLVIRGSWGADLEDVVESSDMTNIDFQWVRVSQVNTIFTPTNGAAFIVYRFN